MLYDKQHMELVRQIAEEKLRIQQIELKEQLMLEEYRHKIKDAHLEKVQFEREIDKLKQVLQGKMNISEVNPSVLS